MAIGLMTNGTFPKSTVVPENTPRGVSQITHSLEPIPQILVLTLRIADGVLCILNIHSSQCTHLRANHTIGTRLISTRLPPHQATVSVAGHPVGLRCRHRHRIVAHHRASASILSVSLPTRHSVVIRRGGRVGQRQGLPVPNAILPAPTTNAIVRLARTRCVRERTPIQWTSEHDLVRRHALAHIVVDRLLRVERSRRGIASARKQIRIMARHRAPRARIIVRHQVPEVEVLVHPLEAHQLVVGRPRRTRHRD